MPFRPRHILAATALAAALLAPQASRAATHCAGASAAPKSGSVTTAKKATLCLLNAQRRKHHLQPLRDNTKLGRAAVGHSRDMVHNKYFEHGDFADRIHNAGYHGSFIGENIAWGSGPYATPKSIVSMWMHSPGHRANILNPNYRDIGIGIANGAPQSGVGGAATYTTDFGKPG
ncbi:MAG TPA: CAP domain-containing protein [Thermoleophilaceae bacterium]|jgi:uncharacterized protein YkwD